MAMVLIRIEASPDIKIVPGSSVVGKSFSGLNGKFGIQSTIQVTPNIDIVSGYHRSGNMFGSGHQSTYMGNFRFKF